MQRYDTYKNSGVKWLGEIPSHWDAVRVKHLFIVSRGRVIAADQMNDEGEYPVYSSQTENNGCMGYISTYDYEGDVLTWTTDGAKAGTVFRRRGKFNCTNVCGVLTPITNNHLGYLYYAIYLAAYYNKRVDILGYKIMSNEMAELKFPLPPFKEQTAIANYLDTATAKIDAAIAQQQKMIDLLNERKQIIINRAVTKGLNPNAKMKDSGVEWIGQIPEHWKIRKLKFLGSIKSGDGIKNEDLKESGQYPVWGGNGLIGYTDKYNEEKNAIVIGRVGALCGNVRYLEVPTFVTDNALIFSIMGKIDHLFLLNAMQATNLNSLNSSNAQPLITGTKVKNVCIPIPPQSEQETIQSYLLECFGRIDSVINAVSRQIQLLQERKQIIINEVVTGKVKVG